MTRHGRYVQLKTLISDVIAVVNHLLVIHGHEHAPSHRRNKDSLWAEVESMDRHMREHDRGKCLESLLPRRASRTNNSAVDLDTRANPLECLVASEDTKLRCLLEVGRER